MTTNHNFTDPCPISGRCSGCGERPENHPVHIRPIKRESK